jgi:hypothetical protein
METSLCARQRRCRTSGKNFGSTIVTSNLPFEEWTSVFGNQRLTGALLDRLTHHVHIQELNGESNRRQDGGVNLVPPMRSLPSASF